MSRPTLRTTRPFVRAVGALAVCCLTAGSLLATAPSATAAPQVASATPQPSATVTAAAASRISLVWGVGLASTRLRGSISYTGGEQVLVGDWDGDGKDGFAVRNGNVYSFRNTLSTGSPQFTVRLGYTGDTAVVGDWDGNGTDTIAVRHGNAFLYVNSLNQNATPRTLAWGAGTDKPLAGDWNGDGKDSFGLRRGSTVYLLNALAVRRPDVSFAKGAATDKVFVGDFNGDKVSTLAFQRGTTVTIYNRVNATDTPQVLAWGMTVQAGNFIGKLADGRRVDVLVGQRSYDPRFRVWELTNVERAKNGRSALQYTTCLSLRYAQVVSDENSRAGRLQHGPLAAGRCTPDAYGENIAAGQTTPESVVAAWMNSSGHRANILNSGFSTMGVGYSVVGSGYRYFWAQDFGG